MYAKLIMPTSLCLIGNCAHQQGGVATCRGAGIALDIAKGLHFLHSHHVMHLDLKSPNILLAQDGTAKIADVGLSRMFTTRSLPIAKVSNLPEELAFPISIATFGRAP